MTNGDGAIWTGGTIFFSGRHWAEFPGKCYFRAMHWIHIAGAWMRAHLPQIAFSLTAMILVVGGPFINGSLKLLTQKFHWLVRYALFVLLSTVGYGLITNFGLQNLRGLLQRMSDGQLLSVVLAVHLVLAWLLKRDNAI